MKDKLINYGHEILNNMIDIGTDVLIFSNLLYYFKTGDYDACKKINAYDLQWLHKQPLKEEIIMFDNLIKEYINIIQ